MEEANRNIETLVDVVVTLLKQQGSGICCDPEARADGRCPIDCDSCKNTFYQVLKNRLMERYRV